MNSTPPDDRRLTVPECIPVCEEEAYKQGSEACRNYSQLTMRTRTLSQQILGASAVGLATALATPRIAQGARAEIFVAAGFILLAFAFALLFVDWHYQSAFTAIRNSLAFMESRQPILGPWIAHLNARTHFNDHIASYFPFLLLAALGCVSLVRGFAYGEHPLMPLPKATIAVGVVFASILFFFLRRCWLAQRRDRIVTGEIDETLTQRGFERWRVKGVLVAIRPISNAKNHV